jgi:hypothetical protein
VTRERLDAWRDRRLAPLAFTLDGRAYTLQDRPARVWVLAALSDEPADQLLDLLPADMAQDLWDDATDEESDASTELLAEIGNAMLARATGRPWWQAKMLMFTLVDDWGTFDAIAADRGIPDVLEWSIERLCHWVYYRLVHNADEKERARIDADLALPPVPPDTAGDDTPPGWEDEAAGWFAASAQLGGASGSRA